MKEISASILGRENKAELVNELIGLGIQQIHYDVMDGTFVKERFSLPFNQISEIVNNTEKHIVDIHLMVNDPLKKILEFYKICDYITFHYESESIDRIRKLYRKIPNINIGIAINPKTNVEQIYEFLYNSTHILVMSVVPGKGGQSFIEETLDKIKKLKKYISDRNLKVEIQVDGGVNNINAQKIFDAGADSLVSGSYLTIEPSKMKIKKMLKK